MVQALINEILVTDFICLKSYVDKLDIDKLKIYQAIYAVWKVR